MYHLPPGAGGLLVGIGLFGGLWLLIYFTREPGPFNLDPGGKVGTFEPFLAKYLRVGEFIVGLATGSSSYRVVGPTRSKRKFAVVLRFALAVAWLLRRLRNRFYGLDDIPL